MADFTTNHREELVISRVGEGFDFKEENDFSKYFALRVALAWALNAPCLPLESPDWERKRLEGERGKEYHLEQITGKGKDKKEDFDLLIRAMLYIKHKEELDREKKDIFSDEKEYLKILSRYIQRGLYELDNTYKSSDCFYQWCLDNLDLQEARTFANHTESDKSAKSQTTSAIKEYFKKLAIPINIVNECESYRHDIIKVELQDSTKFGIFEAKAKFLDQALGKRVYVVNCGARMYSLQIEKPKEQWRNLGLLELKKGLEVLRKQNYALGIFAGMSVEKEPVCFDLKAAPHLLVGGTSGSGKSQLLKVIILCLLQTPSVEITIIDPKFGSEFVEFNNANNVTLFTQNEAEECVEQFIKEMESRYERKSKGESFESMPYKVLVIDELRNLTRGNKCLIDKLGTLAEKMRGCKMHFVLGTQRPDAQNFSGDLRSNVPSRIALKVQKSTESKIILDETGAEKLTGNGDMLIKLSDNSSLQRIIGIYLTEEEIQNQLLVQEIKL